MKKIIISAVVIIVVIIAVIIGGKGENKVSSNNKPIIIGAVISQTGYAAVDGMNIKNGMEMAVNDLKAEGINVKIVYEDDGTDPKQSVSAINKLISTENPDVLMGPIWSFLIDAALPVINNNKIVTFIPSSSSEVVNGTSSYIFYGTYKNMEEIVPLANFLKENSLNKIAIVVSNDSWGESQYVPYTQVANMTGGEVVVSEKINYGTDKDVIPTIVTKIMKNKTDVVLWTGYDEGGTILMKKLQEQGYTGTVVVGGSVMSGLVNRGTVILRATDKLFSINIPMDPAFRAKYIATYKQEPGISADSAYDGVKILVKGIQAGKSGIDLANYLRDGFTYKGYLGSYDFDKSGDIIGGQWTINRLVKQ
jgi:branched-chain amino acid transport system substrate-binding protein